MISFVYRRNNLTNCVSQIKKEELFQRRYYYKEFQVVKEVPFSFTLNKSSTNGEDYINVSFYRFMALDNLQELQYRFVSDWSQFSVSM
jgi:hypothetical protein